MGLYQALMVTIPSQSRYWVDCLPVLTAIEKGMQAANDPRNPLARAHALLLPILEEEGKERVGWMPAHLKESDLKHAIATKSDGSLVTKRDVEINDIADKLAKEAVEAHRVPAGEVRAWEAELQKVKVRAKWVGIVTHEANSSKVFPYTDSESARWRADAARRRREEAKKGIDGRRARKLKNKKPAISAEDGGHKVVRATGSCGWICSVCRTTSAVKAKLEAGRCTRAKKAWEDEDQACRGRTGRNSNDDRQHSLRKSGLVTWCGTCGAFAETRVRRLVSSCMGPPSLAEGGGRRAQLMKLRAGLHPVSAKRLPEAVWMDGTPVAGSGTYARLSSKVEKAKPDGFIPYVPDVSPENGRPDGASCMKNPGNRAVDKRALLIAKAKLREKARRRRLQVHDVELEAAELYKDFVGSDGPEATEWLHANAGDDDDSKMFWENLSMTSLTDRFRHCAVSPGIKERINALCKSAQRSRLDRLGG